MDFEIPYTYEALVRTSGRRRERMVVLEDVLHTSIAETSSDDAVAVALHRDRNGHERTTRRRKGGYVLSVVPGDERSPWSVLQHIGSPLAETERAGIEIVRSFKAVALRAVERFVSGCIVVDGVLHLPSSEPVYVKDAIGRVTSALLGDIRSRTPADRIWRADGSELLLDYLARLSDDKADAAFDAEAIVVQRPDLLDWSRSQEMLIDEAQAYCRSVHRRLPDLSGDVVLDWVLLRDALKAREFEAMNAAALRLSDFVPLGKTFAKALDQALADSSSNARP